LIGSSAKTVETHGFCTYVDSADDQIFEQCDFVPGAPNKCKLTGGTGKFEGLQADIVITASPVKTTDGVALIIGHKKGTYKIVTTLRVQLGDREGARPRHTADPARPRR
jgi:hypothetical protein